MRRKPQRGSFTEANEETIGGRRAPSFIASADRLMTQEATVALRDVNGGRATEWRLHRSEENIARDKNRCGGDCE
ncbi:hypothetical protein L596_024712 [Steinernema carpocapsae]|uniref:Uncharacterized protein n=1 Tax=Steinernema carpocapsae TaxID=34508 RepID=A0A4U5M5J2_STECR|nr:hypothetical protein L596_024712 [Steinernema carpocapsae]